MSRLGRGHSTNVNMAEARRNRNDEFYTQLNDIMAEFRKCDHLFKGKKILCNCNDGLESQFMVTFAAMYSIYGLAGLYGVKYNPGGKGTLYYKDGEVEEGTLVPLESLEVKGLEGNGGFDSEEGIELLKECDLVITNPPFSRFRDYVAMLVEHEKDFLIIGNQNALTYKEIFALFMEDKIWTGNTYPKAFVQPDGSVKRFGNIAWFTNLPIAKRSEPLELWRKYNPKDYPKYDNYDAINVNATRDIPVDYPGVMGVPKTYLNVHCSNQFEVLGSSSLIGMDRGAGYVNGIRKYERVFIQHKNPQQPEGDK